ncbi:hypothetical protein HJ588_18200 [Flexivirga sp. ID2601S]|uniref:Uncharacterized protein n=1 Tax=Flexivirga aerilata TaxID=1656889 RepID=A0A849ANW7_9MICO|nr:hypothetical protein [Flexivirga aerilata]NNG41196.1 hypothetical protein [Flexivirga aerilata]
MAEEFETRTVLSLRTGTKICVLIALGLLVGAVYFYFVPITGVRTNTGSVFGCGSASSPATGGFAEGACGKVADVYKYRAIACIVLALLTAVVGGLLFGADRRQETRAVRTDVDRRHDDDESGRDRHRADDRADLADREERPRHGRDESPAAETVTGTQTTRVTETTTATDSAATTDAESATTRAQRRDSDGKRY